MSGFDGDVQNNTVALNTCRYQNDDTGDCLLDMLIAYQGIADGRKLEMWGVPGKLEELCLHERSSFSTIC